MPATLPLDHHGPTELSATPWDATDLDRPLFARFSACVEQAGGHAAVIDTDGRVWSYAQLQHTALCLAAQLSASTAPVAILLPAGGALAAAFLGALAVGRTYVALDPAFPPERNRLILAQAGVDCMICTASTRHWLSAAPAACRMIDIDALDGEPLPTPCGHADSIAYIIYTSGSTGQPKGVYQDQRGLLHDVMQYSLAVHLHAGDRLSWLYSPSVSGAIRDIYAALLNGATLVAIDIHACGLAGLARIVAAQRLSVFHAIPPLLRAFLQSEPPPAALATVRLAYVAGDRFFASDLALFYRSFAPHCLIYNGIGSTECATLYRHWFVDAARVQTALVPVGHALPQREVRLLDAQGIPVARGDIGEVEVCSPFIARGYWRQPALTRRCFRDAPQRPGWRCFRTGDLARERADGLLEFVGRKDGQIKIRGHRIETGAVEAELRRLPGVRDAVVLALGAAEATQLVACLCGTPQPESQLRQALRRTLPEACVPTHFQWLERIPSLPNFKADLQRLKQQLTPAPAAGSELPADAPWPQRLAACWNDALRRHGPIDTQCSFADQGGDSLAAMRLLALLEKACGRSLPIALVHRQQTFAALSQALAALTDGRPCLIVLSPGFPRLAEFAHGLREQLDVHHIVVDASTEATPEAQAAAAAAQIRALAPDTALHLLGLSYGACVAFDTACRLHAAGVTVASLSVGDMGPAYAASPRLHLGGRLRQIRRILSGREAPALRRKTLRLLERALPAAPAERLLQYLLRRTRPAPQRGLASELGALLRQRQLSRWQPGHLPGAIGVLVAEAGLTEKWRLPADLGWSAHADSVRICRLDGGHGQLLDAANEPRLRRFLLEQMGLLPPAARRGDMPPRS